VPANQVDAENPPPAEGDLRTLKATDLVEFNRLAESDFVDIVKRLLAIRSSMRAREVCIEAAARLDISIETAKRYLLKHSASISEYSIEKGWVQAVMMNSDETRVYTIRWNELGKYLKRGMQMITIVPGPGAETTMLAVVPDELIADLEKRKNNKRKPSLREIMVDLNGWAAFKPGDVKRAMLSGGLGIDVICGIDGMWRLQIWREGSQPSLKEWETVMKSWPEALPEVPYKRFTHNNRQYMRGEWKINNEPISGDIPGADNAETETHVRPDGSDREIQRPE
jgi:hypothetical protein